MIFRGTPYEFNFLGKKVQMIGTLYKIKKMNEYFDDYWPKFAEGLNDIHPTREFDRSYVVENYYSLNNLQMFEVHRKCSNIYAFEGKLTYSEFISIINSNYSNEDLENQKSSLPNGAA